MFKVRIVSLDQVAYLCEECDALWHEKSRIARDSFAVFEEYMRSHDRPGLWSEVEVLEKDVLSRGGGELPGNRMICPRCGQGRVLAVKLIALDRTAFLCDECEALWFEKPVVGTAGFVDFGTYMKSHDRPGLWSEVEIAPGEVI